MKKLFPWILTLAIILYFAPNSLAADTDQVTETVIDEGAVNDNPESIQFNFAPSDGDDIVVNSLTGYKVSNGAVITLDYESTDARDASFFDPPDGENIKKIMRGGIKPGHNQLEIVLNETNLKSALSNDSITIMLGFGDKSSFLNFQVDQLEKLPVHEGSLPATNNGSIEFGTEVIKNDTLVIHSLDGYKVSNGVVLKLNVSSPDARSIILFNPPDGDKVMKTYNNKISNGDNTVTIEIIDKDVSKLLEDDTITMNLGLGSTHTFLFFNSELLKDLPVKEGEITVSDQLNYSTRAMKGDTLTVTSFKALSTGKGIQFELVCDSPDTRSFSLFNPPNGNKIMKKYNNQIKKGKNKIVLKLNEADYNKIMENGELTLRLGFGNKCTFIFLKTNDLIDLPVK